MIYFGKEVGIKSSCAQLVKNYRKEELKGKLVLGVVNLIHPERDVQIGGKLY